MNFTLNVDNQFQVDGEFSDPYELYTAIVKHLHLTLDTHLPKRQLTPSPEVLYENRNCYVLQWGKYLGKLNKDLYVTLYGDVQEFKFPRDSREKIMDLCKPGNLVNIFVGDTANWLKQVKVEDAWPSGLKLLTPAGAEVVLRVEDVVQIELCEA